MKHFVWRGVAAGGLGGLATAVFIRVVTERQIGFALQYEDAAGLGGAAGEAPMFGRSTQLLGGMAAAVLFGAVCGLVLGVLAAALRHRIAARDESGRVGRLAAALFVATCLIPALKYPPNPPTVGDPETIDARTASYLSLLVASVLIVGLAGWLWGRLAAGGRSGALRFLAAGGALVGLTSLAFVVWPASPDPIAPPVSEAPAALQISSTAPAEVLDAVLATARTEPTGWIRDPARPAEALDLSSVRRGEDLRGAPAALSTSALVPHSYTTVIWHFRVQSIAGIAILWTVAGLTLGLLLDRPRRSSKGGVAPTPA